MSSSSWSTTPTSRTATCVEIGSHVVRISLVLQRGEIRDVNAHHPALWRRPSSSCLSTLLSWRLVLSSADGQQIGRRQRFFVVIVDDFGCELAIVRLDATLAAESQVMAV